MTQILIGLTGYKGCGKDTAAAALDGFENVKMAGGLKAMLRAFLAYQGADDALMDRMIEGDLKETPSDLLGGRTPRHAMQSLGTEWGRNLMSESLWVSATERRVGLFDKVVISDIRFPNEADMLARLGGTLFFIGRPGLVSEDQHPSEREIARLLVGKVDCQVKNDDPTPQAFAARFRLIVLNAFRQAAHVAAGLTGYVIEPAAPVKGVIRDLVADAFAAGHARSRQVTDDDELHAVAFEYADSALADG